MNYQLISAILKGAWAIDNEVAKSYFPFIHSIIEPGKIASELSFNEKDYAVYAIERNTSNYNKWEGGWEKAPKNSIAVIPINGPMMRQDQACGPVGMDTIGQRVNEAQANANIKGILFVVNTPGGTVDGIHELESTISAVNKPTVAFIKGMMASAGVWAFSGSNKRIASSKRTLVGSVGVLTSFIDVVPALEKQGYKFHKVLSSYSPDKSKYEDQFRKGDYTAYRKEVLDPLAEDFISVVKKNLPGIKEDQLTGNTYYAQDVIGSFVDAIGDFDFAIAELNQLIDEQESSQTQNSNSNQTLYAMENQYANVNAALGVEALESEEAGIYLQEEQIATLDQVITTAQSERQTAIDAQQTAENSLATVQEELRAAQAQNVKLVGQIENAGAQEVAGANIQKENLEGADAKDELAEMPHNKAAMAKLNEY